MHSKTIDWIFSGGTVLLGVYVFFGALDYGYWKGNTPGSGFFPLLVSVGIISLGIVNFMRAILEAEKLSSDFYLVDFFKPAILIILISLFIWLSHYLGMVVTSSLLVLIAGLVIRKEIDSSFCIRIIIVAILFPVFGYFLFGYYLGVPLEQGLLGS